MLGLFEQPMSVGSQGFPSEDLGDGKIGDFFRYFWRFLRFYLGIRLICSKHRSTVSDRRLNYLQFKRNNVQVRWPVSEKIDRKTINC